MNRYKHISSMSAANDLEHSDDRLNQPNAAGAAPEPPLPEALPIDIVRESFPRIADRIELLWGTWELQQYFTSILISDRGDREGFPVQVVSALLKIYEEHSKIAPAEDPANRYKKNNNFWKSD